MTDSQSDWPAWWRWELELSSHLLKRMIDRSFSEVDLRNMMEMATALNEDDEPGRWAVQTSHESRPWEVMSSPTTKISFWS